MLRAFLRVSQRAVRIQLEHARAPGADVPRRAAPVGGIPGFWVEKPRIERQTTGSVVENERLSVSVKDNQQGIAVGADDRLPVSGVASSPDSQNQPAAPAISLSESTPLRRKNEANSRGQESPKAQREQDNVVKAPEAEEAKARDTRSEQVGVQEAEIEVVKTESVKTASVKTEPLETEPVKTEPIKTEDVEVEAVRTKPIEAEPVKANPVETEGIETEAVKIEGQSALDANVPATETATPSVELDDVEQRPVRSRP